MAFKPMETDSQRQWWARQEAAAAGKDAKGVLIDPEAQKTPPEIGQERFSQIVEKGGQISGKDLAKKELRSRLVQLEAGLKLNQQESRVTELSLQALKDSLSGKNPDRLSAQALQIRGHELTLVRLGQEKRGWERQIAEARRQMAEKEKTISLAATA